MANRFLNKVLNKILIIKGGVDVKRMHKLAKDSKAANEKTLFEILNTNKDCEYGKKYDFANIHSVEDFQKKVPVCGFNTFDPYVDRIYNDNEQNVITSSKVVGFSSTSGSIGKPKMIPITDVQVSVYTKYTVPRMMYLADQYWFEKSGKHISGGFGIPILESFPGESPHGLPATNIVDIPAKKIGFIYPLFLNLPLGHLFELEKVESEYVETRFGLENKDAMFIFSVFTSSITGFIEYIKNNWEMLCDDIEKGIVNDKVFMAEDTRKEIAAKMKPNPERAAELRKEFKKGFDESIFARIWPNMKFINAIGTSPTYYPYTKEIMKYSKGIPIDYSIYGASEGLIAAAYKTDDIGLMMLLDSCFYEFVEQSEDGEDNSKFLTVDQLEKGKEYEIIITTRAGLYRYRFGDVIKVLDFVDTCPVINFSYRKGQLVNVTSEKTSLEQMVAVLERFEQKTNTHIDYWAITTSKSGPEGSYIVLLESKDETDFTPYSKEMDDCICEVNTRYASFRPLGLVGPAIVKNQKPGTFEEWKAYKVSKGASQEQVKPVTVLDTEEKREFFMSRIKE